MTPFTARGVPHRLKTDAWWMAADATTGIGSNPARPKDRIGAAPLCALVALLVLGDLLLYHVFPGVALPVFLVGVAGAAHAFCFQNTPRRAAITAWCVLCASLIPAIDLIQPISVIIALLGMLAFVGVLSGHQGRAAAWAAIRFPVVGVIGTILDAEILARQPRAQGGAILASLRDWIIPATLGLIFTGIMIVANPFLDQWLTATFADRTLPLPEFTQVVFWLVMIPLIWPFLRLTRLRDMLMHPLPQTQSFGQVWYLTGRSVTRALILFNLIFAVQSVTDITILWTGVALPDGLTYAEYAHQGAYPLLFAALLAGGFALLAQPFLDGRPMLRTLLLLWVAQTALLVASSMLRLDLYIDTYGLTRMRVLAFIWMAVIGGGLILMLWQTARGLGPSWLLMRAGELAVIATYGVAVTNVDGLIARHNLNDKPVSDYQLEADAFYICGLSEGALPAIAAYEQRTGRQLCGGSYGMPNIQAPADWREWGYRNARLRRNLAQIEGATP